MSAANVLDAPALVWPGDDTIALAITEGARYNRALTQLAKVLLGRFQEGVIVTANRPYNALREQFTAAGLDVSRLRFVDCVTGLAGIAPPSDSQTTFIESPTMLEKMSLRTEQSLRRLGHSRFLLVDSLSTLAVYNGASAVAELTHNLVNKLRLQHIPAALLLVKQPGAQTLLDSVRPLCDTPLIL